MAEALRPKEQTAAQALGEGDAPCREVEKEATPLVVDWRPEDRGDLEIAMKQGVAVVAYDCHSIRLLRDCQIPGSYGYVGTSLKESIVRLDSADELKANLPFGGASIAGKIGAGLERSATLDIALEMVGRVSTTWREPAREDLVGDCEGATHFVRAAYVGAYAMSTGTKAHAAASVQMFGAGASGDSASGRSVDRKDGNVDDCKKASPGSDAPPSQCGTALRLDLSAIRAKAPARLPGAPAAAAAPATSGSASAAPPPKGDGPPKPGGAKTNLTPPDVVPTPTSCPQGMVSSGGKCTAASNATSYTCDPGDLPGCTAQCDKGDAASCFNAAYMYDNGKGVDKDDDKANVLYDKACNADFPRACAQLAQYWGNLEGQVIGLALDFDKAHAYAAKACDAGQPEACSELGLMADGTLSKGGDGGPKPDYAQAIAFYVRGCQGGDPYGCRYAGDAFQHDGDGVKPDWAKSVDFNQRACDGGVVEGCIQAVAELVEGNHVKQDGRGALTLLHRLCDKFPEHCSYLGWAAMWGLAGWRDDAAAYDAFSKGCAAGEKYSCAYEARMRLDGRGASPDEDNAFATLESLCNGMGGDGMDPVYGAACGGVAHAIQLGKGTKKDPKAAYAQFSDLCRGAFDHVSCAEQALALRDGIGVRANRAAMKPLLVKACNAGSRWDDRDPRACHEQGGIAPATGEQEGD